MRFVKEKLYACSGGVPRREINSALCLKKRPLLRPKKAGFQTRQEAGALVQSFLFLFDPAHFGSIFVNKSFMRLYAILVHSQMGQDPIFLFYILYQLVPEFNCDEWLNSGRGLQFIHKLSQKFKGQVFHKQALSCESGQKRFS